MYRTAKIKIINSSTFRWFSDYNTDAINCVFSENKFPFVLVEDTKINGHYYDKSNEVSKYEIKNNKNRLKTSKMQETKSRDVYKNKKWWKYWMSKTKKQEGWPVNFVWV